MVNGEWRRGPTTIYYSPFTIHLLLLTHRELHRLRRGFRQPRRPEGRGGSSMTSALLAGLSAAAIMLAIDATAQDKPPGKDQEPGQQFHITAESLPLAVDVEPVTAQPPKQIPRGEHEPI